MMPAALPAVTGDGTPCQKMDTIVDEAVFLPMNMALQNQLKIVVFKNIKDLIGVTYRSGAFFSI